MASRLARGFVALALLGAAAGAGARELPDFTELVKQHSPAVVNISTQQSVERREQGSGNPEFDEFFRRFFPTPPDSPNRSQQSLGSGFIVSADGYILTNNHVVEDADKIIVRLSDRRELEAELIGADERSDLAVLKIDGKRLPAVKLGKSNALDVGEWVLAIGSPFGFDYSVTAGIVSAKGRSLPTENNENYVPFIQTDVAINPGNSGGPLFNLDGEVIGINSQIYTRSGGFMGVSFAIPIDVAMEVADQLKRDGRVSRGWLGVLIQNVDRELAEGFGLKKPGGALVSQVVEDGPAEAGGVRTGDIITAFNGEEVDLSSDLPHLVGRARAGSTAVLTVVRDGKTRKLKVKLGELPERGSRTLASSGGGGATSAPSRIGLTVESLGEEDLERLGIKQGVRVVESVGPAAEEGIAPGDIVIRLANKRIGSVAEFASIVEGLDANRRVPILIERNGAPSFRTILVPE
ncbi:MAG: DegQ family serine endoprotease [Pseudomonadota bacterium]